MNNTTILIVEDDKTIQNFLKVTLKTQNYNYIIAETGLSGLSLFYANRPDLVLLDLGLPDIEGIEVLKQIRQNSSIPIIVVSARSSETEKVMALDYGSDDYVTKPFNAAELLARIRAALRHCLKEKVSEPIFELDYLKVDFERRHVWVKDQEIHLTPIEYKMLVLLITNRGKVLTIILFKKMSGDMKLQMIINHYEYLWLIFVVKLKLIVPHHISLLLKLG